MEQNAQVFKEILDVLKDIRRGINILAATQRDKAKDYLSKLKGKRKKMYNMFNGKNSLKDISKKLNTTHLNFRTFWFLMLHRIKH